MTCNTWRPSKRATTDKNDVKERPCGAQYQIINLTQLYLRFGHHNRREVGKTENQRNMKFAMKMHLPEMSERLHLSSFFSVTF